jgi:voltage-gated potassium channel
MRFLTDLTLRRAIGGIMTLALCFTLASAALMRLVEPNTYKNYAEACWWAVQTVSTVGYGDNVPVTGPGRIVATVVMIFGIALIPATTSLVVAVFMNQQLHRFAQRDADASADDL